MLKSSFGERKTFMVSHEMVLDEVRGFIVLAGGPRDWGDTRESWLRRAAQRLGINAGRATSLFYRKVKVVPAQEYLEMKARAQALELHRLETAIHEQSEALAALRADRLLAVDGGAGADAVAVGGGTGAAVDGGAVA